MKEQILRRCGALLIDLFLVSLIYSLAINIIPMVSEGSQVGSAGLWSLQGFIAAFYFIGCDFLNKRESPGKDIMHLRTVDYNGAFPGNKVILSRTLLKLISIALLPFAVIVYLWNFREFVLHDYLTGTSVRLVHGCGVSG